MTGLKLGELSNQCRLNQDLDKYDWVDWLWDRLTECHHQREQGVVCYIHKRTMIANSGFQKDSWGIMWDGFRSISLNLIYRDYQSHIANEGFTIGKEILGRPFRSHSQSWHILQYHKKRFTRHKKDRKHELIDLKGRRGDADDQKHHWR